MPSRGCPSDGALSDFLGGKLPARSAQDVEQHISECKSCQETVRAHDKQNETRSSPLPTSAGGEANPRQFGPYQLLEQLGQGGMGVVYKALHTRLKRVVALKVLPIERTRDAEALARFGREMEAVGNLDHPNIVRATDADEDGGVHYLVMEYVDGTDLARLVARLGTLPVSEACEIVRQAAVGLQHAHEHGLVHRDIKPSNILLGCQGEVRLADLGLAKFFGYEGGLSSGVTDTGAVMGTIDYLSPEQAEDAKRADIRSDIYSLGCTLYHCLTGRPPFPSGTHLQKILAHRELEPEPITSLNPEVPPPLAELVHRRMLAKRPEDRFQTPGEVAEAIASFASGANLSGAWEATLEERNLSTQRHDISSRRDAYAKRNVPTLPTTRAFKQAERTGSGRALSRWATFLDVASRIRLAIGASVVLIVLAGAYLVSVSTDDGRIAAQRRGDDADAAERSPTKTGVAADPDRKLAAAVLAAGGTVFVAFAGDTHSVSRVEDLPNGRFRVDWIDLHDASGVDDAWLGGYLVGVERLNGIALNNTHVTDAGVKHLSSIPSLSYVLAYGTALTDVGLEYLKSLDLQNLNVGGSRITNAGLVHLKDQQRLELLVLTDTRISDEGLKHLAALANLKSLIVNHTDVTDEGLETLAGLVHLRTLNLQDTRVTDAGLLHLSNMKELTELYLSGTRVSDAGVQRLAAFENLAELSLSDTAVTRKGIAELQAALPHCQVVTDE